VLDYEDELGVPWKNTETWLRLSYPFLHADKIKTPTLFLCGENDFNVPLLNTEQMYQALRSLGVPTRAGDLPRPKPRPQETELHHRPVQALSRLVCEMDPSRENHRAVIWSSLSQPGFFAHYSASRTQADFFRACANSLQRKLAMFSRQFLCTSLFPVAPRAAPSASDSVVNTSKSAHAKRERVNSHR
jgi:hypothetical protein